jgi:hypothetical protein
MRRRGGWVLVLVLAVALAGCARDPSVAVVGTVVFDGQPLDQGEIIFVSPDGSVTPTAGPIAGGRYQVRALPGAKKVMINASRLSQTVDPNTREHQEYSFIPTAYNIQTRLTADIKPGDPNEVNFELKSRP